MNDPKRAPDLSKLEADYDVVGELRGQADALSYLARRKGSTSKRRDDARDVVITVVSTPPGDEARALAHLASDTKTLAGLTHRRLVPVMEGRWVGDDAFAVIVQRINDPSLAQLLATGETFTTPRIAAILREVNGLLEWARDHKIVHRSLTPDRVFLEPQTDRVRASFGVGPIQRFRMADADTDARTIGHLAKVMLAGTADPARLQGKTLNDLRPDLPDKLDEATTSLLDEKKSGAAGEVPGFLALIGMADPLAAGESEGRRIRSEVMEEQRVERGKLADERSTFEKEMADARAKFDGEMKAAREKLEAETKAARERLEAERTSLQKAVSDERETLKKALATERTSLTNTRAELERAAAAQKAEVERVAADDRRQIEKLRAEIKRRGELEVERKRETALADITDEPSTLDEEEVATPEFDTPVIVPLEALSFDASNPVMSGVPVLFPGEEYEDEELVDESMPLAADGSVTGPRERVAPAVTPTAEMPSRRTWVIGGVLVVLVAALALWGMVFRPRSVPVAATAPVVQTAPTPAVPAPAVVAVQTDSALRADSIAHADSVTLGLVAATPAATSTSGNTTPTTSSASTAPAEPVMDSARAAFVADSIATRRRARAAAAEAAAARARVADSVRRAAAARRADSIRNAPAARQPTDSLFMIPSRPAPVVVPPPAAALR